MATLLSFSYFGLSVLALTLAPDRILSLSPVPVPRALLWTLRRFLASTASYIGRLLLRHLQQRMVDRLPMSLSLSSCSALLGRTTFSWFAWSIARGEGLGGIQGSFQHASSRYGACTDVHAPTDSDLHHLLGVSRPSSASSGTPACSFITRSCPDGLIIRQPMFPTCPDCSLLRNFSPRIVTSISPSVHSS